MWFSNRALTLVVLPILPIAFVVFFWFGGKAQPLFMAVQIRLNALNTVLQENVAGLKVVRAFGREPWEQARFNRSADAVLEQQLKVGRTFSFLFPVIFLIANLAIVELMFVTASPPAHNTLTSIGRFFGTTSQRALKRLTSHAGSSGASLLRMASSRFSSSGYQTSMNVGSSPKR